jgi:hypothetical protein
MMAQIDLQLDAVLVVEEEVPASQQLLEEAEEQFDRPAVLIDQRDDLGRDIQQVRGDPQLTIAGRAGASAFGFASFDVRFGLDDHQADLVVGAGVFLGRFSQLDDRVPDHTGGPVGFAQGRSSSTW